MDGNRKKNRIGLNTKVISQIMGIILTFYFLCLTITNSIC